jgi:tRNA threonylcarbamoyl adenosine modification protein (Sua5/YciO/YrdC/YwlC family)
VTEVLYIDELYPLEKDIANAARLIEAGAVAVIPTDTIYAVACNVNNRAGVEKLLNITGKIDKKQRLSILCKDIKMISEYTVPYSSQVFRTLKEYTPGPVTFILNANNYLSKLYKTKRTEIGVRIPSNPITLQLLKFLAYPLVSTSLKFDDVDEDLQNYDPEYVYDRMKHSVDLMIHSPLENPAESTIIDCTREEIEIIREGKLIIE